VSNSLLSQLQKLANTLNEEGFFTLNGPTKPHRLLNLMKRRKINAERFFLDSIHCKSGRAYLVAKRRRGELLVCLESSVCKGETPSVFKTATKYTFDGQKPVTAHVLDFTSENLRRLIDEALPEAGPRNLESISRLGLGVRLLFTLPLLLRALRQIRAISDFQLSAGREFSLTKVVKSAPGKYPEWLGHTGLDASTLYGTIAKECFKSNLPMYGTEIDHLIVTGRPEEAISRIRDHAARSFSPNQSSTAETGLQESIRYNRQIIDESTRTGFVRGMTVDTSSLLREEFDDMEKWTGQTLKEEFERRFSENKRRNLVNRYHPGDPFRFQPHDGSEEVQLDFSEEDVMRLALKFKPSLAINKELFDYMSKAMKGETFFFEPSLDEAPKLTTSKELLFYLAESRQMGMPADLIAPNVGFRKREDYEGDLNELRSRVRELSTIASHFGAILDFHSGSDKNLQVYHTVSRACHGRLKLKMSGVYQLLYFDALASFPHRTKERGLFERIWHYTLRYAKQKADEGDQTAKSQIEDIHRKMENARKRGGRYRPNSKDNFFRYYSFIVAAAKRNSGPYLFRDSLYRLAHTRRISEKYSEKVLRQTITVAKALELA